MALTALQRDLCRLIAVNRLESGESDVAGGVALSAVTASGRISQDIDLFHDTQAAVEATWEADRGLLVRHGYGVDVLRERASFIEARVDRKQKVPP